MSLSLENPKWEYYGNLDEGNIGNNKTFWKVVNKQLLSTKIKYDEKITLVEENMIIKPDRETTKVLNNFFSNIIKNLHIQQFNENDPIYENINDPFLKAIVRYQNHLSIRKGFCVHHSLVPMIEK